MTFEEERQSDGWTEEALVDDAEVDTVIRESLNQVLGEAPFQHGKLDGWVSNILEGCLKRLAAFQKAFKYVVTCHLEQKAGDGLHAAACTRWSAKLDGKLTVQWENAETFALVTVYWLAL